jgi:putative ABC transport system permease protein
VSSLGVFLDRMDGDRPRAGAARGALPGLQVQTWLDQAPFYRSVRELYNRIFGALGLIIGVIVVFVGHQRDGDGHHRAHPRDRHAARAGHAARQLVRSLALEGLVLGGVGAGWARCWRFRDRWLLVFPVQMPPPPGRSVGYPLQVAIDPPCTAHLLAMLLLAMLASAWVARRTVATPGRRRAGPYLTPRP